MKKLNTGISLLNIWRSPLLWLLVFTTIIYQLIAVPYWKLSADSAIYISLARALANGEGYTYMGYPHIKYPPGFSLMLMPIEFFFGHNYLLMRWLIVLCAIGSVAISYLLIKRTASIGVACVVSVATAVSYALVRQSAYIQPDIPYMFISLLVLYVSTHYHQYLSKKTTFLLILLVAIACYIRTIGFTLAMAIALSILFDMKGEPLPKRLRHSIAVIVIIALVTGLWVGRSAMITNPPTEAGLISYKDEFTRLNLHDPLSGNVENLIDFGQRIRKNLSYYRYVVVDILTAKQVSDPFFTNLLAALVLSGFVVAIIRRRTVVEYYILIYGSVYLLWPSWMGERFLTPILPMIFYYALQPLLLLFRWCPSLRLSKKTVAISRAAVLSLITLVIILLNSSIVVSLIRTERQQPYYTEDFIEFTKAAKWIRNHTPENAIFIANGFTRTHFYTDRKTFPPLFTDDMQKALDYITSHDTTHIVTDKGGFSLGYLIPIIRTYPEHFHEIHRIGDHIIYEIR